jgi:transposase-like protein
LSEACPGRNETRDHRILYAADGLAARAAYDAFVKKWATLCSAVATSLDEAGLELLTFYAVAKAMSTESDQNGLWSDLGETPGI